MPDSIITDTATKIFQDLCEPDVVNKAEKGEWPTALWDALEESGLPLTWVSDEYGGAGAELADGFAVLRVAGRFAAPVPLAETLLAGWLLAEAKIAAPAGPMTIAPVYEDGNITIGADGKLAGRARHVPFARNAEHIAVMATKDGQPVVALVDAKSVTIAPGIGLSGEPRDTVSFDGAAVLSVAPAAGLDPAKLTLIAAAARAQQMAGALERILEQSVQYSLDRSQFGRPIAK
ncbi:MAG TPA: acyl-CoA dehydrogenase family protein, partial [Stellaceae bacterium]|nr:acyl-CoA dehydrogenase family protein [Stellaceae bacterium]